MSSVKPKQVNNTKKRKASVGANDQQQSVKRVKIEQPNPPQKIQKKPQTAEATQNNEKTKEPRRKIVSKFFEQYYKELITDDEEWNLFCEVLSRKLPITFRINGPPAEKAELFKNVSEKKIFKAVKDIKVDGKALPPPTTIPWYPSGLGYRFNINPSLLQTNNALKEMNDWLFGADMSGSINRQEEVSMIPPLLLDVNSSHKVLDLCSAPGSKTSQILGIMRNDAATVIEAASKKAKTDDKPSTTQKEESSSSVKSKYIKGMIVANDSNFKRCSVMSSMHDAALMITNHRGESFPSQVGSFKVEFDRVLCDVPCSGDGTMRKLPAKALAQWSSVDGLLLHRKQVEICQKGVDLLKPDGRIVYSTCSMNPVENEAVVTEILRKNKDLELVDVKNELPGLLRRPGLSSWKIMSKQGKFYSSYAEYENDEDKEGEEKEIENEDKMDEGDDDDEEHEEKKPDRRRKPIILLPSMFPPKSEAEASNYHLERCLRIYPHLQDTGGFFVAVFKKKKATSKTPTKAAAKTSNAEKEEDEPNKKKLPNKEKRFPSELVAVPQDQYLALKKVFEISDDFPQNQLRVCKEELSSNQIRKIYFFSDAILPFVDALGTGASKDLTVVNAGLIIFERTTKDFHVKHNFSLTVDSLQVIKQYMGSKRLLGLPNKDFSTLVSQRRLFYTDLTNNQNADSLKSLFTGYVIVTTRIKFGRQQQAQLAVLCRNGQGALTLCGNKWDLWPISFLGATNAASPADKAK